MDIGTVERWTQAICQVDSMDVIDLAAAMDIDLSDAQWLGSQVACTPTDGASRLDLVVDLVNDRTVVFVEFELAETVPLDIFERGFGPARPVTPGPHHRYESVVFEPQQLEGTPRGCILIADLAEERSAERPGSVRSVILYPKPRA